MSRSFKAIGFDYGGVLEVYDAEYPFREAVEIAGVSLEDARRVYLEHNHLTNVLNQDWFATMQSVFDSLEVSPERAREAMKLFHTYNAAARLNTELLDMIPRLRAKGFKTGILSNAWAARRKDLEENGVAKLFDVVLVSGEIGAQKPHREAFEQLFKALGVESRELIFIDDSSRSLEKAAEIGYTPLLYKNNEQLFSDLRALGIRV